MTMTATAHTTGNKTRVMAKRLAARHKPGTGIVCRASPTPAKTPDDDMSTDFHDCELRFERAVYVCRVGEFLALSQARE